MANCKDKRSVAMMPTKEFWSKKQFTDSSSMEQWIQARRNIGNSQKKDEAQSTCLKVSINFPEAKYAYNDAESETLRHLKEVSKSNLNVARRNPVTTTDYGFIDMPVTGGVGQRSQEHHRQESAVGSTNKAQNDEDIISGTYN